MFLKEISLRSFRNWKGQKVEFSPGLNLVTGKNAQGKTNLAEAVFFLCTGFSPFAGREKQIIAFSENEAEVVGKAETAFGGVTINIRLFSGKRKQIEINGTPVKKAGDLLGNVNAVFFNPDELKMIKEAPADRRRFLDVAISQLRRPYFYELLRYNKILEQRGRLLKDPDEDLVKETLSVWDAQLADSGSFLAVCRRDFIEQLAPKANAAHAVLTDGEENLEISAETRFSSGTKEEIAAEFYEILRENYERDRRAGFTTSGPHRDDLKIEINGNDVKTYCSQGQKRTSALSVKLAELEIMKDASGEYPLFILDDVLSELDRGRQKRLVSMLQGVQVFLTATHAEDEVFAGLPRRQFFVSNGSATFSDLDCKG